MWATNRTEDWEATSTHPRVMLTGRIASGLPVNQEQSGLGDQAGPKHHSRYTEPFRSILAGKRLNCRNERPY